MTTLGIGPEARRRLGARRTAEIVADELRRQIIDGELSDGDLLPRQEVLVEQFRVSLVSLREALRILETEGLVSVRRGNRGGAVGHAPAKASAAYMLGLLLQSDTVPLSDLGAALQELEPMCAVLAARRADRVVHLHDGRLRHPGIPLPPLGADGEIQLPPEVAMAFVDAELEADVAEDEVVIRRRTERGRG